MVTFILLVIGGLNLGLMVVANWDISYLLGEQLTTIVYVLIGISAVVEVVTHKKNCKMCG